jgi:hypothetical protein
MPITVKSIVLWRKEIENQPGTLASTLEPFASGGADLQVVMVIAIRAIRRRPRLNFIR